MHILLLLSIVFHLSSRIHESRLLAVVHAAKGEATVGAGVMGAFIQPDDIPSVADTSGDSNQRGIREKEEPEPSERKARQSRTFGILALGTIGLGLLLPVLFAGVVPLGILAIVKGTQARKEGSRRPDGRVMGIVALSLLLLGLVMGIVFLATPGFF
jgi:hypothetical protein